MRYHLILVRMAIIRKTSDNKCWQRIEKKELPYIVGGGCKLVKLLWRIVWRVLKRLKLELPCDPVIPLLGIYLKETKIPIWKVTCTPIFIAALFTITKIWKQPKCPSADERIKKMCCIFTFNHRKEWKFAICSNKDGLGGFYTWWNKSEKEKCT